MNPPDNDPVAQKLAELRARFADAQKTELAGLVQRVEALERGHAGDDALQASYRQLHRLAGSAGTLGFPVLGQEARILEQRLKPLAQGSEPDPAALAETLDEDFRRRLAALVTLLEEPV